MKVYAGYSKNQDMRMSSSSGAVFSSLAGYVLKQQGMENLINYHRDMM